MTVTPPRRGVRRSPSGGTEMASLRQTRLVRNVLEFELRFSDSKAFETLRKPHEEGFRPNRRLTFLGKTAS